MHMELIHSHCGIFWLVIYLFKLPLSFFMFSPCVFNSNVSQVLQTEILNGNWVGTIVVLSSKSNIILRLNQ